MSKLKRIILFVGLLLMPSVVVADDNAAWSTKFMYDECKQESEVCLAYLAGLRHGYLAGSLNGRSSSAGTMAVVLNKYLPDAEFAQASKQVLKLNHMYGEKVIGCYSTISADNIKRHFIRSIESREGPDDIMVLISKVLNDLMNPCARS